MTQQDVTRRAEIERGLASVRRRIDRACIDAGRASSDVTLVVITKTRPTSDVRHLFELGVRDIGENRDQEAAPKAAECADLDLVWHFVGQLQTNKARSVAGYADVVHSVDRVRLARALAKECARAERRLAVFVQARLDDDPTRGGAASGDLPAIAAAVAAAPELDLRGVMAVAPLGGEPLSAFRRLRELSLELRREHPHATLISAGMSGDLEPAIAAGATHVRVGSAVLGSRPPLG
jgi:PLP dependent protein